MAECPPGDSNPITSGSEAAGPPVIFSLPVLSGASFFLVAEDDSTHLFENSNALPPEAWLVNLGDLEGRGEAYFRIEAPGEGLGGWGDPRTSGCPSTAELPHPPLGVLLYSRQEDFDKDGAWDVFEDGNRNFVLDPGEDRDRDGRLTRTGSGCEGFQREDQDCDGRVDLIWEDDDGNHVLGPGEDRDGDRKLDYIDEDRNHNGVLDPGEDRNGNGKLDTFNPNFPGIRPYIEDRNGNFLLDDRPFPSPDDLVTDETGIPNPRYPYGSLRPTGGAVAVASVAWNGTAYDFSAIDTPTRLITLGDGRRFRVVDATPGDRLIPHPSGAHIWREGVRFDAGPGLGPAWRVHVESEGVELNDDRSGRRRIFDFYVVNEATGFFPSPRGDGAAGGFIWLLDFPFPFLGIPGFGTPIAGRLISFHASVDLPPFVEPNILDSDWDAAFLPLDNCPDLSNPPGACSYAGDVYFGQCDANFDGIGDACDPALDPQAEIESSWIRVQGEDSPGPRAGAAAVYDPRRGVVVLFGGSDDVRSWEYDGASWRQVRTVAAPEARRGHRMVYDSTRGRVLLFGGKRLADGAFLNDLWGYDGSDWTRVQTAIAPQPRSDFGFAYDSSRDLLVLFGGASALGELGDTWLYDGVGWKIMPSPRSPPSHSQVQMAFDSFHQVTTLYFGSVAQTSGLFGFSGFNETWEFDGDTWQPVEYRGNAPLINLGTMVFDAARRQMILFSGRPISLFDPYGNFVRSAPGGAFTFLYDGLSWTSLPTRPTLPPRYEESAAFDTRRGRLVVHGGTGFVPLLDTQELQRPDDTDDDGVPDLRDNCPLRANADQADADDDESCDACDNCPETSNRTQRDLDRDGLGDACDDDTDGDLVPNAFDVCPSAVIPGHHLDRGIFGVEGRDTDGDGTPDDCDHCPRDAGNDLDGDGICGDADNCSGVPNPLQEDRDGDGGGDACQPVLILSNIRQDGGETLEVSAVAEDPNGDSLSGALDFFAPITSTLTLLNLGAGSFDCNAGFSPEGVGGEGIAYFKAPDGEPLLVDLDSWGLGYLGTACAEGFPDFWMSPGTCAQTEGLFFDQFLSLSGLVLPADICVRRYGLFSGGLDLRIFETTEQYLSASVLTPPDELVLHVPFASGLPRLTDISTLTPGTTYRLQIAVTDGSSVPVRAERSFLYQGESTMVIGRGTPRAVITAPGSVECIGPAGGAVILDGSGSEDGGFGTPLVSFEWFEDQGEPTQRLLGLGPALSTTLELGVHAVSLTVTDAAGATGTTMVPITVQDTVPPVLSLSVDSPGLWPPNHRLVRVLAGWSVMDACDPSPGVTLQSVISSELDDAPGEGDGSTTGDIAEANVGSADTELLLRAERAGTGAGRTYELAYLATDASGNRRAALAMVVVPHDQANNPEPLLMLFDHEGAPGMASIQWSAVPGATGYDLIVGELDNVAVSDGRTLLGPVRTLVQNTSLTCWSEGHEGLIPEPGRAFFYLLQYHDVRRGSGYGTVSAPRPREPSP